MFGKEKDKSDVIETLPMVPLRDVVVFPHMMIPFVIGRPSSIKALEYALVKGKRIFLSAQHDATRDNPGPEEIHTLGTLGNIVQSLKLPDGNVKVLVEGLDRGRALEFKEEQGFFRVVVKLIPKQVETGGGIDSSRFSSCRARSSASLGILAISIFLRSSSTSLRRSSLRPSSFWMAFIFSLR